MKFCEQTGMKILNGFFEYTNIHRFTWQQESRQLQSITDYIIVKQKQNRKYMTQEHTEV